MGLPPPGGRDKEARSESSAKMHTESGVIYDKNPSSLKERTARVRRAKIVMYPGHAFICPQLDVITPVTNDPWCIHLFQNLTRLTVKT